jgi:hypothetical protein
MEWEIFGGKYFRIYPKIRTRMQRESTCPVEVFLDTVVGLNIIEIF